MRLVMVCRRRRPFEISLAEYRMLECACRLIFMTNTSHTASEIVVRGSRAERGILATATRVGPSGGYQIRRVLRD